MTLLITGPYECCDVLLSTFLVPFRRLLGLTVFTHQQLWEELTDSLSNTAGKGQELSLAHTEAAAS